MRIVLPARLRGHAAAEARLIAEAAAAALAGQGGAPRRLSVELQGAGRTGRALASDVAGRVEAVMASEGKDR